MPTFNSNYPSPAPVYATGLVDRINLSMRFRRYFKLVSRRWIILFVSTALGLSYSLYKVSNLPPRFDARAELEIKSKLQVASQPGAVMLDPMETFYADQLRIMQSGALRARVLSAIRKGPKPPMEPSYLECSAGRGQGSSFSLNVSSSDPDYARLFATNWGRAFLDYKREQSEQAVESKKYSFLQDLTREQRKLDEAHAKTEAFRKEHQIGGATDLYRANQEAVDRLRTELAELQTKRQLLLNSTREALATGALAESRFDNTGSGTTGRTKTITDLVDPLSKFTEDHNYALYRSQLNDKINEYNSRTNTLRAKHPHQLALNHEIEALNQRIDFQLKLADERRNDEVKSLKSREDAVFARVQDLTRQVTELAGVQQQYDALRREETRYESSIQGLRNTLQSIELANTSEGQFNMVGDVVCYPVAQNKGRMILQGTGLGFLLGLALVYFLHRLDDRLELAEDIEQELEEPVLGQVPQVDMRAVKDGCLLITKLHHHNMFAESIRGVRSAVLLGAYQGRKQALVVSSAVPGDGKTTFTVNFAATLAIAGNRVLLVDADLRRGNVHGYFRLQREPGLAEVLLGETAWRQAVHPTELPTLQVIGSGRLPTHPGELLVSPIMQQLVEEARRSFDYLVIDCPPLTAIDDTFSLLSMMDGLLFVVRSGQTSMRFAKTALAAVRQRGANILGIVLNGITADNPYYYYNYYYHSYYNRRDQEQPPATTPVRPPTPTEAAAAEAATHDTSILATALMRSGVKPTAPQLEKVAADKAEIFKARRAARRAGETAMLDKSAVSAAAPGPPPPKPS